MNIIPKLNINKTPQSVENGSIVCAKNIKLSPDGSYITNDDGIKLILSFEDTNEKIVGVIPCNTELVVFTYNTSTLASKIYRYNETTSIKTEVPCGWKYNNGTINGTFTYNVNDELIIAVAEYDANTDVPFKTINLNRSTTNDVDDFYNIAPVIPQCNMRFLNFIKGTPMACGSYYFFIRYELTTDVYTNWFPVCIPLLIADVTMETVISHHYPITANTDASTSVFEFSYNKKDTTKNFNLSLTFANVGKYINYQIGYILQHDETTIARIWNKFPFESGILTKNILFNGVNPTETTVDNLLNNTFNLYNVKNIDNYNNRLYVANYKETKYNVNSTETLNLQTLADNIYLRYTKLYNVTPSITGSVILTANGFSRTLEIYKNYNGVGEYNYIPFVEFFNNFCSPAFSLSPITPNYYLKDVFGISNLVTNCIVKFNTSGTNLLLSVELGYNITDYTIRTEGGVIVHTFPFDTITYGNLVSAANRNSLEIDISALNRRSLIPDQIYNFFVHYVRKDGTYTNGLRISNNTNYYINIGGVNTDLRKKFSTFTLPVGYTGYLTALKANPLLADKYLYEIINNCDTANSRFGYYRNSDGDVMFKAPEVLINNTYRIGVEFNNITIPPEFIGVFFSYEKVEYNVSTIGLNGRTATTSKLFLYSSDPIVANKSYGGVLYKELYKINYSSLNNKIGYSAGSGASYYVDSVEIIDADNVSKNNAGREYYLSVNNTNSEFPLQTATNQRNVGSILSLNNYIYTSKNKTLVSLGQILYKPNPDTENNYVCVYNDTLLDTALNYDGYSTIDNAIIFDAKGQESGTSGTYNTYGVSVSTESIPYDNAGYTIISNNYALVYDFGKYTNTPLLLKEINVAPIVQVATTYKRNRNLILNPSGTVELYKFSNDFVITEHKSYTNYDATAIDITSYDKTIRRSNVIQTESLVNSWREFPANGYKIIGENKGKITNLIGVGLYLLVHTEHSLFMFNRNSSMQTVDKDVMLKIPDAFDVDYQEVFTADKGYGGLQDMNAYSLSEYGYIFYDNSNKKLYKFDNGALDIISQPVSEFLDNYDITSFRFAYDKNNNRLLARCKTIDNNYITFSFSFITKDWLSMLDYKFDKAYNTKSIGYLFDTNALYTFDKSIRCIYGVLGIKDSGIFPVYSSDDDSVHYSYIDIIFNNSYETIKSLESISYVLSEIVDYKSTMNQAESQYNARYSGNKLLIYSDSCNSGEIDISVDNLPNSFNNYKKPVFDKGFWNFNYFRNYRENKKSDYRSLIYGKYFVCRFVFDNSSNKKFKLENIIFNTNRY